MATADVDTKETKAAAIARRLTDDIVNGHFAPGTALDETSIAARYGVSRTPIREAIRQLAATGFIESRPHKGAVVCALSDAQLDDVFAVMAELEGLCARGAALAMTAAEQRALETLLAAAAPLVEAHDIDAYTLANERFHEAIYAGAHNAYLMRLTLDTRAKLAPYRQAQFVTPGRLAHSFAEHGQVVDAILARDGQRAQAEMRAHLVVVRSTVDTITHAA